jgi:hypothetical protein
MFFTEVGKDRTSIHIGSWFGHPSRESTMLEKLQTFLGDKEISSTVEIFPSTIVDGDGARGFFRGRSTDRDFDAILIMDVYWLDGATLDKLCQRSNDNVYYVGRMFNGYGDIENYQWEETVTHEKKGVKTQTRLRRSRSEGLWYRREDDKIVFLPDTASGSYAPHPDVNWLFSNSFDRDGFKFEGSRIRTPGFLKMVKISRRRELSVPIEQETLFPEPVVGLVDFEKGQHSILRQSRIHSLYTYVKNLFRWSFNPRVPVFVSVLRDLEFCTQIKSGKGYTLDVATAKVRDYVLKQPGWDYYQQRFPTQMNTWIVNTTLAVLFAGKRELADVLQYCHNQTVEADTVITKIRKGQDEGFFSRKVIGALVAALLGATSLLMIRRKLRAGSAVSWLSDFLEKNRPLLKKYFFWLSPFDTIGIMVHVVLEEVFKRMFPNLGLFCIGVEAGAHTMMGANGLLTALMHMIAWSCNLPGGIFIHALWNYNAHGYFKNLPRLNVKQLTKKVVDGYKAQVRKITLSPAYQKFRDIHFSQGSFAETCLETITPEDGLRSVETKSTDVRIDRGSISKIFYGGNSIRLEDLNDIEFQGPFSYTYPVLITNGALWRPERSPRNIMCALIHRMHRDPLLKNQIYQNLTGKNKRKQMRIIMKAAWTEAYDLIDATISGWNAVEEPTIEECIQAFSGFKRTRFEQALCDVAEGQEKKRTTVHMKFDEVLHLKPDIGIKPRGIVNSDPKVQAISMQTARWLGRWLKANSGVHYTVEQSGPWGPTWKFCFFYAGGMTSLDLSKARQVKCHVVIFIMGDDSHVYDDILKKILEGDFSMYDQSQTIITLFWGRFRIYVQKFFKLPDYVWELVFACIGRYMASVKDFTVKGFLDWLQGTGISDTSSWNSVTTLVAWLFVVYCIRTVTAEKFDLAGFVSFHMARLGLNIKLKEFELRDLSKSTFLKGWWVPAERGDVWIPLPSQLLKLGKTLEEPGKIYKCESFKGVYCHAYSVARSLQHVPRDYPLLGSFLSVYDRLGTFTDKVYVDSNPYKTAVVDTTRVFGPICRTEIVELMCDRYSTTPGEIEEVEEMFDSVSHLPMFVSHPLFLRLRDVDYGDGSDPTIYTGNLSPGSVFGAIYSGVEKYIMYTASKPMHVSDAVVVGDEAAGVPKFRSTIAAARARRKARDNRYNKAAALGRSAIGSMLTKEYGMGKPAHMQMCSQMLEPGSQLVRSGRVVLPSSLRKSIPDPAANEQNPAIEPGTEDGDDHNITLQSSNNGSLLLCIDLGLSGWNDAQDVTYNTLTFGGSISTALPAAASPDVAQQISFLQAARGMSASQEETYCIVTGQEFILEVNNGAVLNRSGSFIYGWIPKKAGQTFDQLRSLNGFSAHTAAAMVSNDHIVINKPPQSLCINNHFVGDGASLDDSAPGYLIIWGIGLGNNIEFTFNHCGEAFYFGKNIPARISVYLSTAAFDCLLTCWLMIFGKLVGSTGGGSIRMKAAVVRKAKEHGTLETSGAVVSGVLSDIKSLGKAGASVLKTVAPLLSFGLL